jgi:hypothetical protein
LAAALRAAWRAVVAAGRSAFILHREAVYTAVEEVRRRGEVSIVAVECSMKIISNIEI